MSDFTTPAAPAAPAGDPEAAYSDALQTAMEAPTPQARAKAVDTLEALARQRADAGAGSPAAEPTAPPEGFEPPATGLAYQFEQALPPGLEIADETALGVLKSSLASAGMPAEIANAGFSDIARLTAEGAFENDGAYDAAVALCRAQLHRVHGEGAKGLIADAVAWIEEAVRANPTLEDAATAALASPMAIQAAANMRRFGSPRPR